MLNLNAGVHLNKVVMAIFIQKFKSPCAAIIHLNTGFNTARKNRLSRLFRNAWRWRFFDYLLVATLKRAIAIAQMNSVTLTIGQNLNLHMAWVLQEFFHIHSAIAESCCGLCFSDLDRINKAFFVFNYAHTATTTASGGFNNHRIANTLSRSAQLIGIL